MKTFVYVETRYHNRKRNNREARIYRVVNNQPKYLGVTSWSSGATRGSDSEVFQWLMDNGYIPKSYCALSESAWQGKGYYCQAVEEKGYKIIRIE